MIYTVNPHVKRHINSKTLLPTKVRLILEVLRCWALRFGVEICKEDNLSDWYSQVIIKSEMIEFYEVDGCYIMRPWSFALWDVIATWFDARIKSYGVQNCYFPSFLSSTPLRSLYVGKGHLKDFTPQVYSLQTH